MHNQHKSIPHIPMSQTFITIPLGLMRPVPLVLFWVKSMLAGTARAKVCGLCSCVCERLLAAQ